MKLENYGKEFVIKLLVSLCITFIHHVASSASKDKEFSVWIRERLGQPFRLCSKNIDEHNLQK